MKLPRIRKRRLAKRAVIMFGLLPLIPWGLGWSIARIGLEAVLKKMEEEVPRDRWENPLGSR